MTITTQLVELFRVVPVIKIPDLEPKNNPMGGDPIPPSGPSQYYDERPPTPYPQYRVPDMIDKKNGFFHLQFRDVLYALSLVCVGLLFVFQRQSEVKELSGKVDNMKETMNALVLTVSTQQKLIDQNSSQISLQTERNLEQDKRIAEAQQQLIQLVPGMVEIRTKLNFVADLIDVKAKGRQ